MYGYLYEGSPEDYGYGYYAGADMLSYAQAPLHYAQELGTGIGTTLKQAAQGAQRGLGTFPTVPSNPFGGIADVYKNLSPQGQLDAMQNDLSRHAEKLQTKTDRALRIAEDTADHVKDTSDTVKIAVIALGALGAIAIIYSMVK